MSTHEVTFTNNRKRNLAIAWCSCGWRRAGALQTVQCLAASHDLDEPEGDHDGEVKTDDKR